MKNKTQINESNNLENLLSSFSLNDLIIFKSVYELRNNKEVAAYLNTSTATISRRMSHLTQYFDSPLFTTKDNTIYHSEFATELYTYIDKYLSPMLNQIHLMKNAKSIHNHKDDIRGLLRVQLPNVLSRIYITPNLIDFMNSYPNVNLEVIYSNNINELLSSKIDISLTLNRQFVESEQEVLNTSKVVYAKLYCTKEYVEKYGYPQNIAELNEHNWVGVILPDIDTSSHVKFVNVNNNQVKKILNSRKIKTNNSDHNLELIISNKFIAPLLPTSLEIVKKMNIDLIEILPEWEILGGTLHIITNKFSNNALVNSFRDFLLNCLKVS